MSESEISDAREASSPDPRVEALLEFAVVVLREPAAIDDDDLDLLRDDGYNDRQIADTVALVALNQLTGSFNLVAGLEPAAAPAGV